MLKMHAIICDMDGTLLDSRNQIMPLTKQILINLQAQGIRLILASGRSYTRIIDYALDLKMDTYGGYIIDSNGVSLLDVTNMERVFISRFNQKDGQDLFDILIRHGLEFQYLQDSASYLHMPKYIRTYKEHLIEIFQLPEDHPWTGGDGGWIYDMRDGYKDTYCIKNREDVPEHFNKVMCTHNPKYIRQSFIRLKELPELQKYSMFITSERTIDIMPANVSKGNTLSFLLKKLNINSETAIVFGDSQNDISMFGIGTKSVAMANASNDVQRAATNITQSNNDEGIYNYLKQIIV